MLTACLQARTLFGYLGFFCGHDHYSPSTNPQTKTVLTPATILLDEVERYFATTRWFKSHSNDSDPHSTSRVDVVQTYLPPLYLQTPGHSMVIAGIEKLSDGSRNLIVLDPAYPSSSDILTMIKSRDVANQHVWFPRGLHKLTRSVMQGFRNHCQRGGDTKSRLSGDTRSRLSEDTKSNGTLVMSDQMDIDSSDVLSDQFHHDDSSRVSKRKSISRKDACKFLKHYRISENTLKEHRGLELLWFVVEDND